MFDLTPTTRRAGAVAAVVTDEQLDAPTSMGAGPGRRAPSPRPGDRLPGRRRQADRPHDRDCPRTRARAAARGVALPEAWTGMTMAGGVELPGEVCPDDRSEEPPRGPRPRVGRP
jgi:hypothetical protein